MGIFNEVHAEIISDCVTLNQVSTTVSRRRRVDLFVDTFLTASALHETEYLVSRSGHLIRWK
jgi:hypothetical protein